MRPLVAYQKKPENQMPTQLKAAPDKFYLIKLITDQDLLGPISKYLFNCPKYLNNMPMNKQISKKTLPNNHISS